MNEKERILEKFECEDRLNEIKFYESIEMLDINSESKVLDLGSGTGVFTFEIAKTAKEVVSVEVKDIMIEIQEERIESRGIENIRIVRENIEGIELPFEDGYFDRIVLSTIVHEVEDKDKLFSELKRVTSEDAKILIIEFKKKKTDYGPPLEERISKDEVENLILKHGFKINQYFEDMESFYKLIVQKNN